MTTITISTAVINYPAGTTDCQLSIAVDVPTVGQTFVANSVSLSSADLGPDWTDDQLCAAVAVKLGVDIADVSVAVPFVPPAPSPSPEPIPTPEPEPVVTTTATTATATTATTTPDE